MPWTRKAERSFGRDSSSTCRVRPRRSESFSNATFALQVGLFSLMFNALTAQALPRLAVQFIGFVIAQGVATTVNFIAW